MKSLEKIIILLLILNITISCSENDAPTETEE